MCRLHYRGLRRVRVHLDDRLFLFLCRLDLVHDHARDLFDVLHRKHIHHDLYRVRVLVQIDSWVYRVPLQ